MKKKKNTINILGILLFLISAVGLVLTFISPVASANVHVVNNILHHDYKLAIILAHNGSTVYVVKGQYFDNNINERNSYFDVYAYPQIAGMTEPYPFNNINMKIAGISLVVFGAFLSIFSSIPILTILALVIGISGAIITIIANCLLIKFTSQWKEVIGVALIQWFTAFSGDFRNPTYKNFSFGWFGPVLSSGLIAIGLIFFIVKKYTISIKKRK